MDQKAKQRLIKFTDLVFSPHHILSGLPTSHIVAKTLRKKSIPMSAVIDLPNGYRVSIVIGDMFYSNGIDTYEAMVINGAKKKDEDPYGYLTKKQLMKYLNKIARRKPIK